jgi:DNA-binding transcriptional ArsR family regulator
MSPHVFKLSMGQASVTGAPTPFDPMEYVGRIPHMEKMSTIVKRFSMRVSSEVGNTAQPAATKEDELMKAMAQKERRSIIEHILKQHMNISELARTTSLDRATVSYHLGVLEDAGLVVSEYEMIKKPASMGKIGRYYRVKPDRLTEAAEIMEKISKNMLSEVKSVESRS